LPLPLKAPLVVKAGARVTLEAQNEHWFALQMRGATKAEMTNPTEVRESFRQEYLAGRSQRTVANADVRRAHGNRPKKWARLLGMKRLGTWSATPAARSGR
jgi:hypothetical protein